MRTQGISEYRIDTTGSTVKGDGYLGVINFVKVIAHGSKGNMVYDLVVKSALKGEELRKQAPVIQEAYIR